MNRQLILAPLLVAGIGLSSLPPAAAATPTKALIVSLDGGGENFLDHMVAAGVMPNLAAIRRSGTKAAYALTNYPSKTAAGHASLWTGAYGGINGVTANEVPLLPRSDHTILEARSGFDSGALRAEPIWATVAKSGKNALVVQATHETPFMEYAADGRFCAGDRLTMFDGYTGMLQPEWLLDSTSSLHAASGWVGMPSSHEPPQELEIKAGDTTLWGLVYDDPSDPVQGYDTLQIRPRKDSMQGLAVLKAGPSDAGTVDKFSLPIPISCRGASTSVVFRLFDLAPDASSIRLYRTAVTRDRSNRPDLIPDYVAETGAFIPKGAEDLYMRGKLGPTLLQGGGGQAEDRLLETIHLAMISRINKLKYASKHNRWDLLVNYVPYPDGLEHLWYGLVDDQTPAYNREVGPKLWPFMESMAGMVDEFLGAAREVAGDQAVLTIVSDHGMDGIARDFLPNVALRKAGLLALDAHGDVDLARTQALYSPNDGAYVMINTTDHKDGIVPPADVPKVVERVTTALRAIHDPLSHRQVVTAMYQAAHSDPQLGIGGPTGGDLYLDLIPGLYFDADWKGNALFKPRPPFTSGGHVFNPARNSMHAICYMSGPGVRAGATIPPVRTIDVAPTLCELMGIRPPAQATGRVLTEALISR